MAERRYGHHHALPHPVGTVGGGGRTAEQDTAHCTQRVELRGTRLCKLLPKARGGEPAGQRERGTRHECRQRGTQKGIAVEQRQAGEQDVRRTIAEAMPEIVRDIERGGMRGDVGLRRPGRPGRVLEHEDVVETDISRGRRAGMGGERIVVVHGRMAGQAGRQLAARLAPYQHHGADRSRRARQPGQPCHQPSIHHQHRRVRMVQVIRQQCALCRRIDGHRHGTEFAEGEIGPDELRPVTQHDGHMRAVADTGCRKPGCQEVGLAVRLGIRRIRPFETQERMRAVHRGLHGEHATDRHLPDAGVHCGVSHQGFLRKRGRGIPFGASCQSSMSRKPICRSSGATSVTLLISRTPSSDGKATMAMV